MLWIDADLSIMQSCEWVNESREDERQPSSKILAANFHCQYLHFHSGGKSLCGSIPAEAGGEEKNKEERYLLMKTSLTYSKLRLSSPINTRLLAYSYQTRCLSPHSYIYHQSCRPISQMIRTSTAKVQGSWQSLILTRRREYPALACIRVEIPQLL